MGRRCFGKLVLEGIGTVILGNVLCAIMTAGIYVFGSNIVTKVLSVMCGVLIFQLLILTFGWREGKRERGLVRYKRVEREKRYRCLTAGIIMFVFAAVPSALLLLNKLLLPREDFIILYQFISGSAFPFVQAFVPRVEAELAWAGSGALRIDGMSILFPILMCAYYLLIPFAAQFGFWCGYENKLDPSKIVYK